MYEVFLMLTNIFQVYLMCHTSQKVIIYNKITIKTIADITRQNHNLLDRIFSHIGRARWILLRKNIQYKLILKYRCTKIV